MEDRKEELSGGDINTGHPISAYHMINFWVTLTNKIKKHPNFNGKSNYNSNNLHLIFIIRRKLCTCRLPIVNRVIARKTTDWSKFYKGVKQGIQLACVRCPNAQESS